MKGDSRSRLGDARAENDKLLNSAFIQTEEYRVLLQHGSGYVVVGRRGTGKSALFCELRNALRHGGGSWVVSLEPDGSEVAPIHAIVRRLSARENYHAMQEVAQTLCRYMVLMEVACDALLRLPAAVARIEAGEKRILQDHSTSWKQAGSTPFERLYGIVAPFLNTITEPGLLLGELNRSLNYHKVLDITKQLLASSDRTYTILADRLDEGFEPGTLGVAFINGIVSAATDLSTVIPALRPTVFIRDNIFRSIQDQDSNYTRNIEGRVMRLHWDETNLLRLVARRMKIAFKWRVQASTLRRPT